MIIKRKSDINNFLRGFGEYAEWDGKKYYFTINDPDTKGSITIMNYPNGEFTFHRKNELFWDINEHSAEVITLTDFLWKHRKDLNTSLKQTTF